MEHEAQMERRSTRADEQLQRKQIQDLVAKDSTVAIAAADRGEDYYLLKVTSNGSEVLNRSQPMDGEQLIQQVPASLGDIFTFANKKTL